jgi:hypothetical protein
VQYRLSFKLYRLKIFSDCPFDSTVKLFLNSGFNKMYFFLQTVESPEFVELIRYLNPTKKTFSRRELGRRIVKRHQEMVEHLSRFVKNLIFIVLGVMSYNVG